MYSSQQSILFGLGNLHCKPDHNPKNLVTFPLRKYAGNHYWHSNNFVVLKHLTKCLGKYWEMVYKPFHSELYQKSPKLLYFFNPSEAIKKMTFLSLWILNTQHTPCLIASGAVHLIGNFPPSKLKSAPLASPKSDTCKNKKTMFCSWNLMHKFNQ